MPEQTKVMGKDWAEARREGSVDRLRLTLQTALADQTVLTFELGCGHGHWLAAYGAAYPAEFCVGIDLVTHRVERSQRKQALGKLDNVVVSSDGEVMLGQEFRTLREAKPQAEVINALARAADGSSRGG